MLVLEQGNISILSGGPACGAEQADQNAAGKPVARVTLGIYRHVLLTNEPHILSACSLSFPVFL